MTGRALICFGGLLMAASLLAGCAVNQEQEVAKYRQILDGPVPQSVEFAEGDPLSLEAALLLANQHHEQLAIAGEDYLQALIDKDRAAAAFLPTVSLIPSYAFADSRDEGSNSRTGDDIGDPSDPDDDAGGGGGGSSGSSRGDRRFDVPLNARANLFNGFRDVANLRAAGATIEQRRALLLDLQATVLLDVARTYYQVLRSERSVEVLRRSVEVQDERVRDMRARRRAGVARPLDVAQTEAQAASTRVTLIAAESDVRNGRTLLAFLTGAPVQDSPLADGLLIPAPLPAVDDVLTEAAAAREDLAAARAGVDAARQDVEVAVGQYYPSVTLNLNTYLYRESNPTDSDWNGLLSMNLPIFTGGVIHANVRDAWSRFRQTVLDESFTRREILRDVESAYGDLLSSTRRLEELDTQLTAAQEALRQAEASYDAGLGTNLERVTSQAQLLNAQLDIASESFDQKVFYLNLLRASGRLGTTVEDPVVPTTGEASASAAGGTPVGAVPAR